MKFLALVREKKSLARLLRLHRLPLQPAPIAPATRCVTPEGVRAPPQTDLDFGP